MSDPAPAARPPAQRGPGRGLWALIGAAHVVAVGLLVAAHWNGGLHVHRPGHGHHELRSVGAAPARPAAGGSPPPPPPHRNPYLWEAVHWLDRHRAAAGPAAGAAPAVEGERAAGTAGGDGGGGGAPYAGKKVALMGMAESYTWKDLATYVGSAREAGFAGDIVLFTNTADAETRRWFGLVGVRQVQWDRQWTRGLPGNTARHALYARFAPEYDFVLASDTRDVHFQRDPFGEEELRAGADLHVYGEPATLGNNAGHDGMFRRCFNPSFLQTNAKRSMLNGGAMFGTGAAVGAFSGRLTAFVHEFVAFAKAKGGDGKGCMGSDQIVVNYLLYGPPHRDGKLKDIAFKVWEHGTGLVNNRVLMDKRYSEAERAKMKNAAGEVLNHDGRVACVVHKGHYRRRKPKFEAAAGALLKADKGKGRVNPYSEEGASALTERAAKAGAAQGTPPAAAKCVLKNDRSDCGERPGVEGDVQQFPQLRPALEAAVGGQFCLGMLSMQGVKTLQRTLDSYCRNGLLGLAGEKVLFFQNDEPGTEIYKWRREIAEMYGFEVMTDRKNVAYQSFDRMAKACGKDFIAFLEEGFKLVEQRGVVLQQLDNAFRLDVSASFGRRGPGGRPEPPAGAATGRGGAARRGGGGRPGAGLSGAPVVPGREGRRGDRAGRPFKGRAGRSSRWPRTRRWWKWGTREAGG